MNGAQKITEAISRELVAPVVYRCTPSAAKIGWTKDKRNNLYFCYGIDVLHPLGIRDKNGNPKRKRHREKPIALKEAAEIILVNLKLRRFEKKYYVVLTRKSETTLEQLFNLVIPIIEGANEKNRALRVKKHLLEILPPYYLPL